MLVVIKFHFLFLFFYFQYIVPETSKNSWWKQFWDYFKTDDEGTVHKII